MKGWYGPAAVAALCVALAGCRSTVSAGGALTLTLRASGGNDGALVLVVSGGPVSRVTPLTAYQATSTTDAAGTHILLVGNLTAGPLATLTIPDQGRAGAYVVTVQQVADRTTFALIDPVRDTVSLGTP